MTFPDLHNPRKADSHEMTRKDVERAILLEMDWLQKCKQAFVDWDSDEENEEEGRAEWSILKGRKRYETFYFGQNNSFKTSYFAQKSPLIITRFLMDKKK